MLDITKNGKTVAQASSWGEVTLAQFIELYQNAKFDEKGGFEFTMRQFLEATSTDIDFIYQLDAGDEDQLMDLLAVIEDVPDFLSMPVPKTILGVTPPAELGEKALFQKWSIAEYIDDLDDSSTIASYFTMAPFVISVYLYPLITGQVLTKLTQLDEIKDRVNALPCTDALPLAAFFLSSWNSSTSSGETSFKIRYPELRSKRSLKTWFRSLMPSWSMRRSTRSRSI
jgi:hypothetical protein